MSLGELPDSCGGDGYLAGVAEDLRKGSVKTGAGASLGGSCGSSQGGGRARCGGTAGVLERRPNESME